MFDLAFWSGVATGVFFGGIFVAIFWYRGKKARLFDERWKGMKLQAQGRAFAVGLVLVLAAWAWTVASPRAPSAVILLPAIYTLQVLAAILFLVRGARSR